MLRPTDIDKTFDLATDTLTCLWGGLIAGKLRGPEFKTRLAPFKHLISFTTSFAEDSHLSKENYFNICASDERFKTVANYACCMVAVLAFESLKEAEIYEKIKKEAPVVFLKHLRDAGAHGNSFNFFVSSSRSLDPGSVQWREKIITKELQDNTAFPDFFAQGDFAYLFEDISKIMKTSQWN